MENNVPTRHSGWSWGGFMFSPAVIFASRRYVWLLLYLLMIIPLINIIGWLIPMIVLGIKGRDLIMASHTFANQDEAPGFMKGIDHAGKIVFWITLILIGLGLIFALVMGFGFLSLLGGWGAMMNGDTLSPGTIPSPYGDGYSSPDTL